jgi:hypothetical protein
MVVSKVISLEARRSKESRQWVKGGGEMLRTRYGIARAECKARVCQHVSVDRTISREIELR